MCTTTDNGAPPPTNTSTSSSSSSTCSSSSSGQEAAEEEPVLTSSLFVAGPGSSAQVVATASSSSSVAHVRCIATATPDTTCTCITTNDSSGKPASPSSLMSHNMNKESDGELSSNAPCSSDLLQEWSTAVGTLKLYERDQQEGQLFDAYHCRRTIMMTGAATSSDECHEQAPQETTATTTSASSSSPSSLSSEFVLITGALVQGNQLSLDLYDARSWTMAVCLLPENLTNANRPRGRLQHWTTHFENLCSWS